MGWRLRCGFSQFWWYFWILLVFFLMMTLESSNQVINIHGWQWQPQYAWLSGNCHWKTNPYSHGHWDALISGLLGRPKVQKLDWQPLHWRSCWFRFLIQFARPLEESVHRIYGREFHRKPDKWLLQSWHPNRNVGSRWQHFFLGKQRHEWHLKAFFQNYPRFWNFREIFEFERPISEWPQLLWDRKYLFLCGCFYSLIKL